MEKPNRVIQVYGYTVCVVAIITFLICTANFVNAVIDLSDPMHAGSVYNINRSPSLASFENYKMDILKTQTEGEKTTAASFVPDDQTLKAMYNAAKEERIQTVRHNSIKNITVTGILNVISILLFITHWLWMRKAMRA